MTAPVAIGLHLVGPGLAPLVVAELSGNHNGDFDRAISLVRAAAAAGAGAVKLQTYTPDTMTLDLDDPRFVVNQELWRGRTLHDLYAEAMTPWEWHADLFAEARSLGLLCFSSPFDLTAVELLESLDCPAYKIASLEIGDLALIAACAATGKPVIISTGGSGAGEIDEAVDACRSAGDGGCVLLRCTAAYPAPPDELNLATITDMRDRWSLPIGFSDHTLDGVAAVVAVSLGACLVEKHFTLARSDGGPDAAFSMEPEPFAAMVDDVRAAHEMLGSTAYGPSRSEEVTLESRRSLYAVRDIAAGTLIGPADVRSLRPAGGLAPRHLADVLGSRAVGDIPRGTPLAWSLLDRTETHGP